MIDYSSNINIMIENQFREREANDMFDEYGAILTVEEVMEILMIGKNGVYDLLNSGEINSFRIGRMHKVPKVALEEYILAKSLQQPKSVKRKEKKRIVNASVR